MLFKILIPFIFASMFTDHSTSELSNLPTLKLTLDIQGVQNAKGKIFIAAYRKKDNFPTMNGEFKNLIVDAKINSTLATMELPADTYAIAVFHDVNNNTKLDKNMFGIPTEIYGFSNNARATFSAPSFKDASFELNADKKISIKLK